MKVDKNIWLSWHLSPTIVGAASEAVEDAVQLVLSRIAPGKYKRVDGPFQIDQVYQIEPSAGAAHLFRLAVYAPTSAPDTSVILTNLADGWHSLSGLVAKELKRPQIQIVSTQEAAEYPQNLFEYWLDGESARKVMVMRDTDQWVFFEEGVPQEFEETSVYSRKIKKQRLTRDLLLRYLAKLGWDAENSEFWSSSKAAAYFYENRGQWGSA